MKEDFLHYLWVNKKLPFTQLKTHLNENLEIQHFGQYLQNAGPDIFNARILLDNQIWVGNIEIHVKSSDWYLHKHEENPNFDAVILHVVWEHDCPIFRKDNTEIPTLELKNLIEPPEVEKYQNLIQTKKFINCENDINKIDAFKLRNYQENLFIARLEQKAKFIQTILNETKNDWETVTYFLLCKYFGLKTNGITFYEMAKTIGFSNIRKESNSAFNLEALFFGTLNLIPNNCEEIYSVQLTEQYNFLKQKYQFTNSNHLHAQFFKLRPDNFPTIRLSQLANLLENNNNLFSEIITTTDINSLKKTLKANSSIYWKNHYNFCKESKERNTNLSENFISLLIINVVLPLLFTYQKSIGNINIDWLIEIAENLKPEKNSVIDSFSKIGIKTENSFHSQSILQLKTNYCDLNKCLNCTIGLQVLKN
jgi:hypothetical protein